MQYISATEAKQKMAALLDAAQKEPITIRRQNRDAAVVLSPETYDRLRGVNVRDFNQFCDSVGENAKKKGLTIEKLNRMLEED